MNIAKLLNDKRVLYVVGFFTATNLIGYLVARNYNAVLFFLLISLVVKFFTQNISVILGSALIITNLVIGGKMIKESFEGKDGEEEKDKKGSKAKAKKPSSKSSTSTVSESVKAKKTSNKSGMANIHEDGDDDTSNDNTHHSSDSQEKMASGKKSQLDYAGTIESAYDNLDKLLSSDALKNMSLDTQRLAEKQKRLMGSIKNLEPMMNQANKLLQGLDMSGINNMMSKISDMTMITGIGGGGAGKEIKGAEEK